MYFSVIKRLMVLVAMVFVGLPVWAAPGDLDLSFGNGAGTVITTIGAGTSQVYAMIRQADGKLVVAGRQIIPPNPDFFPSGSGSLLAKNYFVLVRYNKDGSLDTSFNDTGKIISDFGDAAYSVIQQADGKLVATGIQGDSIAVLRFNTDGTPDSYFGGTGKITTPISNYSGAGSSIIQQPDGKLVVAVSAGCDEFHPSCPPINTSNPFYLIRYNADGSLDTSFDSDGIARTTEANCVTTRSSVIQTADGKLVVVGDAGIAQFNVDGSRGDWVECYGPPFIPILLDDPATPLPQDGFVNQSGHSVIQQTDGKFLIAGNRYFNAETNGFNFVLTRLQVDGIRDTSFNVSGQVLTDFNQKDDSGNSLIQQMDGKYLIAGYAGISESNSAFAFALYNQDGSLDNAFGTSGKLVLPVGINSKAASVIQQPDGKLIVAGNSDEKFALVRIESGEPDADGDGIADRFDAFPLDGNESVDTDSDGVGNNADSDDDNDGVPDFSSNPIRATAITVGPDHACAITSGTVQCWGNNDYGQTTVPTLINPIAVSAGYKNTCVLDDAGVHCWGSEYGEYGGINVPLLDHPVAVTVGIGHACALDATGVHCWGANFDSQTDVPALVNPVAVSAGFFHTCALDDSGVHCWGATSIDYNFGQTVVPALSNPVAVFAGGYHTCALDDTGLHCWGSNNGEYNDYGQSDVPVLEHPVAVSTGTFHTCAVDDTGVHCWGYNESKQTDVPALQNPVVVSANGDSTCAIDDFGLHCWGANDEGQTNVPTLPLDNCRLVPNLAQLDTDSDGIGDACDNDDDNDGVLDTADKFPLDSTESVDTDNDGLGNNTDTDDDNDGVPDVVDSAPLDPAITSEIVLPLNNHYQGSLINDSAIKH